MCAPAPHAIWRTFRRPFRSPFCRTCTLETYDFDRAGCIKCGAAPTVTTARHFRGRRDLVSAEHSMRTTVGYGDPARGQAREL